jgi:phosphopantothenoylcysteine decarboxylase/phosphopantothenate--cysteine ligase
MRFLVSGGPTHEYLDDVRYLGNPSSGAMGIAVAEAASARGHEVTLVLGPTHLPDPDGVAVVRVTSALEMHVAMTEACTSADAVVMTAAVSDYRPSSRAEGKIKKGAAHLVLELAKTPDILGDLGRIRGSRVLLGFALEAAPLDEARDHARDKLVAKNLDAIVLNRRGSFGGAGMEDVSVLEANGSTTELGAPDKASLAGWLVAFCEERGVHGAGGARGS